jgi:non-ribosomal peptide synthetase component E (peptide arylation enzyme)
MVHFVGQRDANGADQWQLRVVPPDLACRYVHQGWWTDAGLGSMVADGLSSLGDAGFAVHSKARPWRGTMREVDRAARAFAASLRANGVGPGHIVVFHGPAS